MASWERIAKRAEAALEKANKKLEVIAEIISYDDRDEDEKLKQIVELLQNNDTIHCLDLDDECDATESDLY
jgi:hypothetical protein